MILMFSATLQALIKKMCERKVFDMTDAEIMKALENCNSTDKMHCLLKCPYYNYSANCLRSLIDDAIALINRQNEQIEKLENIERIATKTIETQNAEIERLQNTYGTYKVWTIPNENVFILSNAPEDYEKLKERFRAEAIKEFAERLKNTSEDTTDWGHPYVLCKDIDNLVKEMTE